MSVTFVALATPNPGQPEALARYTKAVGPLIQAAGGRPGARLRTQRSLLGEHAPAMILLVEFPDEAAVERFLDSDAYKALLPDRNAAFQRLDFLIAS